MRIFGSVLTAAALAIVPAFAAQAEEAATDGVLIQTVAPKSPAAQVGLKAGDRILAIDGTLTADAFDMAWALSNHEPGSLLEMRVMRNGQAVTIQGQVARRLRTSAPVSARSVSTPRYATTPVFIMTPAEINDQRAFGD